MGLSAFNTRMPSFEDEQHGHQKAIAYIGLLKLMEQCLHSKFLQEHTFLRCGLERKDLHLHFDQHDYWHVLDCRTKSKVVAILI